MRARFDHDLVLGHFNMNGRNIGHLPFLLLGRLNSLKGCMTLVALHDLMHLDPVGMLHLSKRMALMSLLPSIRPRSRWAK
jgi:hypothetical protein